MDAALDNPFWSALTTRHQEFAQRGTGVARYPADVAPFLGVASPESDVSDQLDGLISVDERIYLLGVAPSLSPDWSLKEYPLLAQMVCEAEIDVPDGPDAIELGEAHRADVLALTALVYPHFFRPRTMDLGRYFGIYLDGRLAAMIGERLGTPHAQEVSAVCTHPDFLGRGLARRLLALLSNQILQRGQQPFLHVAHENTRAVQLYRGMGYRLRRDIPFWSLCRGEGES